MFELSRIELIMPPELILTWS